MKKEIKDLIDISRFYGADINFVIAGGGNTSYKDDSTIWIKASGTPLATLTEEGLVALNREKLHLIAVKAYSDDAVEREEQVKNDLNLSIIDRSKGTRPSVETSLHEIIKYSYVVHTHPALVNGILCSRNAKNIIQQLFGDKALFVPYTDPGYTLFKRLDSDINDYRNKFSREPQMIFLENHGVFAGANTTDEVKEIYNEIISKTAQKIVPVADNEELPFNPVMNKVLPAVRMMLSNDKPKIIRYRHNSLIAKYYSGQQEYHKISLPVIPDTIVYCKSRFLYIEQSSTAEKILDSFRSQLPRFESEYGYLPKVIIIKNMGVFAVDDTYAAAGTVLDVFEDLVTVCEYAVQCGGVKFMTPDQSGFIDKWEVENYRRKVAAGTGSGNRLADRIAIVTGAAQGFGAGIAEALYNQGMNVAIADLNEETGAKFSQKLNSSGRSAKALFIKTDVSDPASVKSLVSETVSRFGGLDLFVSNAGILRAGGLDEMEPEVFTKTTSVNYNGYFYCAKYASEVMKIQNQERPAYFTDIVEINSKSGLRGSNRNFAYSGSKFGGIGLTQSFALELAPFKIKVNAICPGNFYEGPLWSDPHNGLFVQYLKTGKVPGARTIEDVKKFYEDQVPMKRGCRLEDVIKALLYIIDQEYETGQAFPVTGGQVMLG